MAGSGGTASVAAARSRRMSAAQRREQLLDVAMAIVREEGADRLTLGHVAARAGVSKPVAYDHFGTRSELLIALYRSIDAERVAEFRHSLAAHDHTTDETIESLSAAYIDCAADTEGEFFAVGAALSGSDDKSAVVSELLDNYVEMFAEILDACSTLEPGELRRRCVGLVGAGEALSSALVANRIDYRAACDTLAALIRGGVTVG